VGALGTESVDAGDAIADSVASGGRATVTPEDSGDVDAHDIGSSDHVESRPNSDDAVEGVCSGRNNGDKCDDQNKCTLKDRCHFGTCIGDVVPPGYCNDGDSNTIDICDPKKGCTHW